MQSAPAFFNRRTDQLSSRSGRRPGPVLSYAIRSPALRERAREAGRPNSGSRRMALACGVSTRVTMVLNSSIMEALISLPFSLAKAFCSDPRWSIAAAAITPRSFETAFMPANFPGVSFMVSSPMCPPSIVNVAVKDLQHDRAAELLEQRQFLQDGALPGDQRFD